MSARKPHGRHAKHPGPSARREPSLGGRVRSLEHRLAREQDKLEAVLEVAAALTSTRNLDDLLRLIVERITRVMEADRSTLYLLDEARGELWSKVLEGDEIREIRLPLGTGIAGWAAQTGRSVALDDAYEDPRFDSAWDRATGYRTRTILAQPMCNPLGRTIGVVQVLNRNQGHFTDDDAALLQALASQAAVSIENARLFLSVVANNRELIETQERLEEKVRELDLLFEVEQAISRSLDLDELLDRVIAKACALCDAEAGSILLLEEDTGALTFRSATGNKSDEVLRYRIPAGSGICGWVAERGEPQIVNDVDNDPRHSRDIADRLHYWPRSILCVPLETARGRLGAMELLNKGGGHRLFGAADVRLATMLAGHISTAIELARAREERSQRERLSTIGQMLSGVLHDLRTPMTIVSGYVQMMAGSDDAAERSRHGELVLKQLDHINAMTREVLAFARGENTLLIRKVYLNRFLDQIGEQIGPECAAQNVRLDIDASYRGIAHFDEVKIRRAFLNLVRNALEAVRPRGRGTLTIRAAERGGRLSFEFADDGPGIPEGIRGDPFRLFVSAGKTEGTGLGLAIVKRIVDEHGGTIAFETGEKGTVFRIELPPQTLDPHPSADAAPLSASRE